MNALIIEILDAKAMQFIRGLEDLKLIKVSKDPAPLPGAAGESNKPSVAGTAGLKEHEIVVATTKIATVPKGATGTVVHSYANGDAYEVEFIINGKSMVETALKNQIEKK